MDFTQYRMVYQGGHHDVFCNGKEHVWCYGGSSGMIKDNEKTEFKRGPCDCASWGAYAQNERQT